MIELNLLQYQASLQTRKEEQVQYLFDPLRKKWLVLQPEEVVRQLVLTYLLETKAYNRNRIAVEKQLIVNKMQKRCDILVYHSDMRPYLLVECKAPQVPINQGVFKQIATYNMALQVDYLMVTNGIKTFCCQMDYEKRDYTFVADIPDFPDE